MPNTTPLINDFLQFYVRWIKPDRAYVVITPSGGTRFVSQRIAAQQEVAVVGTSSGGRVPPRDCHIYAVDDPPPVDGVSTDVGQILHRSMCGVAKLGDQITLGEIRTAAEAQVRARMADRFHQAPVVAPVGAASHGEAEDTPVEELPDTAVQICVGDRVFSRPYHTPQEAEVSEDWRTATSLPQVVIGQETVWLRKVKESDEKESTD